MKEIYKNITQVIVDLFRYDLQLHMLWSFFLSMFGIIWYPLVLTGFMATVIKELLDLWIKDHWSWDDFIFGVIGNFIAIILINII